MLTKVGPHEHSSVQQHFTSLLVSSMVANKDNMYWCYLPTIASIQGHPGKKLLHCQDLIISCCKYSNKDLLDQKLAPTAPQGLHSAQTRHGSALRELAQFEPLAPDHDPSVKISNTPFLWVQTKLSGRLEIL